MIALVRVASAQPATPEYPEADVDRPLLMYAGMTRLDISLDFPTYVTTSTDPVTGLTTTSTSSLGHTSNIDIAVAHSFGPAEVTGQLVGDNGTADVYAGVRIRIDSRSAFDLELGFEIPEGNIRYDYFQDFGYVYRALRVPQHFVLYGFVGGSTTEFAVQPPTDFASPGYYTAASVGGSAEVQLASRLSLYVTPRLSIPISHSSRPTPAATSLGESSGLLLVLGHWDFYAQLAFDDVTGHRHPFANAGFVHRWGG